MKRFDKVAYYRSLRCRTNGWGQGELSWKIYRVTIQTRAIIVLESFSDQAFIQTGP